MFLANFGASEEFRRPSGKLRLEAGDLRQASEGFRRAAGKLRLPSGKFRRAAEGFGRETGKLGRTLEEFSRVSGEFGRLAEELGVRPNGSSFEKKGFPAPSLKHPGCARPDPETVPIAHNP
jgi:hypothetical protein